MTEGKDLATFGRPNGIDVTADSEDMLSLFRSHRVVQDEAYKMLTKTAVESPKQTATKAIGRPTAARKEAMKGLVMAARGDVGLHQGFGHRVRALRKDPSRRQHDEVGKAWLGQAQAKRLFPKRT